MKKSSERSDVMKHSNAGTASFSSSPSEDLSVSNSSRWSALMTRSLEFPDRTGSHNFRGEDGEMDDSSTTVSNISSPIYSSGSVIQSRAKTGTAAVITSWLKGDLLGRGSFGPVYEGISADEDFFAVKEVSIAEQGSQAQGCIQQLEKDISLLSPLQHQNIVRYLGTAKDGSILYIFLELVTQGSLLKLYQRYPLRNFVASTDIRCANILVDASGSVKLADFGLAKVSKLNDIMSYNRAPFWMAPEVINPKRTNVYGSSADIWSLGCTVLEMLTRQFSYSDLKNPLPDIPDTLSLDARDFITKCLKVNPEEQPTAAELLNHPFASSGSS
uniref:Protein kinase domain-containing protein n=1 Tax=Brassica oleracea var. oleracea TaxID=109376 RepID=A0A0D3CQS6_BRAOL